MELIYPSSPAPVLPGSKGVREMLPIVEANGLVTFRASRAWCHSGAKPLHPVVHLHIINRFGQVYLQKRSATKALLPLRWDTAVGGHISYGELLREALFREAREELSLVDFNPLYIKSYVFESAVEKELVNVFAIVGAFNPVPDGSEVADGRFWDVEEIESAYGKDILTPNFEQEFAKLKTSLLALL